MRRRRTDPQIDIRTMHDPEVNASLYVSSELPRRMVRWFEQHLLECDDCWREVWLARRGRLLAEHAREMAPASLRDAVRGAVQIASAGDAASTRRRRRFGRRRSSES
jgi:hypothetical protein